jgi:hypothetical protein
MTVIAQVYDRDDDSWTNVPTNVNSACSGWARLPDGRVGMFAGHYPTLQDKQVTVAAAQHRHQLHSEAHNIGDMSVAG